MSGMQCFAELVTVLNVESAVVHFLKDLDCRATATAQKPDVVTRIDHVEVHCLLLAHW